MFCLEISLDKFTIHNPTPYSPKRTKTPMDSCHPCWNKSPSIVFVCDGRGTKKGNCSNICVCDCVCVYLCMYVNVHEDKFTKNDIYVYIYTFISIYNVLRNNSGHPYLIKLWGPSCRHGILSHICHINFVRSQV